jgi:hypothetical protein
MTEEQHARMEYLRKDLKEWEDRRRRARWSLPMDKLYNCTAMDRELGAMQRELHDLEEEERQCLNQSKKSPPTKSKRRPASTSSSVMVDDCSIST